MPLNLPHGSEIVADSAYIDYDMEGLLAGNGIIRLWAARKKIIPGVRTTLAGNI
jgi:hypothetical protein